MREIVIRPATPNSSLLGVVILVPDVANYKDALQEAAQLLNREVIYYASHPDSSSHR